MNLILFVFGVIGMTNILVESTLKTEIVESDLFKFFKEKTSHLVRTHRLFSQLFSCHQCCGFWCGLICGWCVISTLWTVVLVSGFAGSFLASAYVVASDFVVSKTDFVLGDQNGNNEE